MKRSIAIKTGAVTLLALAGVTAPSVTAHADDPLLCGVLSVCDDTLDQLPVDIDLDLDSGVDVDVDTDLDQNGTDEVAVDVDLGLTGDDGRIDVDAAANAGVNQVADVDSGTVANVVVDLTDGALVTADAESATGANVPTPLGAVVVDPAIVRLCGVQVVVLTSSDSQCGNTAGGAAAGAGGTLADAAALIDACGVTVNVLGTADSSCGSTTPVTNGGGLLDVVGNARACGIQVTLLGTTNSECGAVAGSPGSTGGGLIGTDALVDLCGVNVSLLSTGGSNCVSQSPIVDPDDPSGPTDPGDPAGPAGPSDPGTPGVGEPGTGTGVGVGIDTGSGGGPVGFADPNDASDAGAGGSLPLTGASVATILVVGAALVFAGTSLRRLRVQ